MRDSGVLTLNPLQQLKREKNEKVPVYKRDGVEGGEDSLSRIGSILGVPLYADECTTHQYRISFARLLIEMDVTKELPKEVQIEDVHGKVFKQQVMYDWTPPFCGKCKMVGHDCSSSWQPQPRSVRPAIQKKTVQKWDKFQHLLPVASCLKIAGIKPPSI